MNTIEFLTFIVAIIGAGAWLPHIINWYKERSTLAKVTLVPDNQVDVGYTSYGAMFNLNLALATSKKDIIIDKMEISLKHEKGEYHNFIWQGLNETISEISNIKGEKVYQTKDQAAIAMKLVTSSLAEKFVRFQELNFPEKLRPFENKLTDLIKYYNERKKDKTEILQSKEFYDLIEFFKSNFWWQEGKYIVDFNINSSEKFIFDNVRYQFDINKHDIEELKKNIDKIHTFFEHLNIGDLDSYMDQLIFHWPKVTLIKV